MEEEEEEGQGVESVTVDFQGLKPRYMIQILKVNDPMFGFPTPPHGSPLPSSHLSISPLIQMGFPTQVRACGGRGGVGWGLVFGWGEKEGAFVGG